MSYTCKCGRIVDNGCECGLEAANPEPIEQIRRMQASPTVGYLGGVRLEPINRPTPDPEPETTAEAVAQAREDGLEYVHLPFDVRIPTRYSEETVQQTEKAIECLVEYAELFAAKQESYGRGNIDGFGELGVLVRLNDKVERLKNLIYRGKSNDLEAVEDTWLDVIGYGLIGLMIHRGRW